MYSHIWKVVYFTFVFHWPHSHPTDVQEVEGQPLRAILYLVHGLGEHIKRYESIAREFSARGIRVHGFDHRGHGETLSLKGNKNKMVRGHLGELEDTLGDVDALMQIDSDIDVPRFLV